MKKCVAQDFKKLESLERDFFDKRIITKGNLSKYAFFRPSLFKMISKDTNFAAIDKKSVIIQFIYLPLILLRLILNVYIYKQNGMVFCTERNDETNSCRYVNCVPSIKKSNYLRLRYSFNHKPFIFDNVIDIAPLILIIKAISRLYILNLNDKKLIKDISNSYFEKYNIDTFSMIKKKVSEYILLKFFFELLIKFNMPKRIVFVSNNFFIPLITLAKDKSIPTYEVAHALAHEFHPNYSFKRFAEHNFYPDFLIESDLAFNLRNDFLSYRKILYTSKRKEMTKNFKSSQVNNENNYMNINDLLNSNKKILLIGQGFDIDSRIIKKMKPFIDKSSSKNITFREHPAHRGLLKNNLFNLSSNTLEEDLNSNDIIMVDYSQVMLIAYLMKKDVVALNKYWYKAIESTGINYRKLNYD